MRKLANWERERLEEMIRNWVLSRAGARTSLAMSSVYADVVQGKGESFESRIPVLQVDADRVEAAVFGRKATGSLPAVEPMPDTLRDPFLLVYLHNLTTRAAASRVRCPQQTLQDRLERARWHVWESVTTAARRVS